MTAHRTMHLTIKTTVPYLPSFGEFGPRILAKTDSLLRVAVVRGRLFCRERDRLRALATRKEASQTRFE